MAWPKGQSKPKTGGRKKGAPNKRTLDFIQVLEAMEFCPAVELIRTYRRAVRQYRLFENLVGRVEKAVEGEEPNELFAAIRAAKAFSGDAPTYLSIAEHASKELMQYKFPKRKSIELSGKDGGPLDLYLRMSPEERAKRRAELESRLKKKKAA